MITVKTSEIINEYVGVSTDELPLEGVPNGSTFYEMDSMNHYIFDAENKVWRDMPGNGCRYDSNGKRVRVETYENTVYPLINHEGD